MYFKFAMNFIAQKASRTVLSILLCVISVIVIVFTVILGTGTDYAYRELDSMLNGGVENVAYLNIGELNSEFAEELATQPEINAVGDIQTYTSDVFLQLSSKCNVDLSEIPYNNEIIFMNCNLVNLYDISLQSGKFITEISDFSKNYLYLGAGFKEIPVGTTFSTESSDYIVAGILSDNQRILNSTVVNQINHNQANYTVDGDYCVLSVSRNLSTDALLLNAAEGYTLNDALDKAFALAEKYDGVNLKYTTMQTAFDGANEDTTIVRTIISRLMPVMIISCALMILVMQLSDIYGSLHEYGIMCSVGFTQNEVEKITVIKNVITFIAAFVISLPLTYWMIYFWYSIGRVDTDVILHLLLTLALPAAIGIVLCTIAVSTVISIALMRKHTLVQMIGGHND